MLASKYWEIPGNEGYKSSDFPSTIKLAETEKSKTRNSKHIDVRYFYIKEKLEQGTMELKYLPTGDMIADIFTKPLQGNTFYKLRGKLMNLPTLNRLTQLLNFAAGDFENGHLNQ